MKNTCTKWKDALLETALTEAADDELDGHLSQCADCAAELRSLRTRTERMDALLRQMARAAEPSPNLSARILVAAEASEARQRPVFWRAWALAGVAAAIVVAAMLVLSLKRKPGLNEAELQHAQALAQWQAPSDVFLKFPGRELLSTTPRLGESYFTMQEISSKAMQLQTPKQ